MKIKRIAILIIILCFVVGSIAYAGHTSISGLPGLYENIYGGYQLILDRDHDTEARIDSSGRLTVSVDALTVLLDGLQDDVGIFTHNGTDPEAASSNLSVTLLASAARTATTNSSDQTNKSAKGVVVTVDVTAITATPILTPNIQCKDEVSGKYENMLTASATITATGTHSYIVYPGVGAASGDIVQVAGFPLCRVWRVAITHSDTDSATYSVGAHVIQ